MKVLILADEVFASRERVMLSRLEIGLADEGIRVVQAVPERADQAAHHELFSQTVSYSNTATPFGDRFRARHLMRELGSLAADDERAADVIHVFGGSCWSLGVMLARRTGAPLALEVWRAGLAIRARESRWTRATDAVFLAPDPDIERMLRDAGAPSVRPAFWGVHASENVRRILPEDRIPAVMVVGGGREPAAMRAVIEGLAETRRARGEFAVFLDARAARRAGIWPVARKYGMLDAISLIDELEGRRDLLLHGDILVHPDHAGEQRSILLDAMASGMVVLAAPDPHVSVLQEGRTCQLVRQPTGAAWAAALSGVLADHDAARQLSRSAWQFIRAERPATRYVRAVLDTYSWLTSRGSIPFRAPA